MQRFDETPSGLPASASGLMRRIGLLVVLALAGVIAAGCVERHLTFTTDRDYGDVEIELDGHPIGKTPCSVIFHRYGARDWVARAEGYEIASGRVDLAEPWYQYPVIDLLAEGLLPWKVRDHHGVTVTLDPLTERSTDDMYQRAQAHRAAAERDLEAARERQRSEDPLSPRSGQ